MTLWSNVYFSSSSLLVKISFFMWLHEYPCMNSDFYMLHAKRLPIKLCSTDSLKNVIFIGIMLCRSLHGYISIYETYI
jgi:hypothetical protein